MHVAYNSFVYGLVMYIRTYGLPLISKYGCCKEVRTRLQYASTAAIKLEGTLRDA